jgi:hypothetical protein
MVFFLLAAQLVSAPHDSIFEIVDNVFYNVKQIVLEMNVASIQFFIWWLCLTIEEQLESNWSRTYTIPSSPSGPVESAC